MLFDIRLDTRSVQLSYKQCIACTLITTKAEVTITGIPEVIFMSWLESEPSAGRLWLAATDQFHPIHDATQYNRAAPTVTFPQRVSHLALSQALHCFP